MQALVYQGPNQKNLEDRAKPAIQLPTDAIVRVTKTTICGTDLHILKGDVATCQSGTILGHEGVGVVDTRGRWRHHVQAGRQGVDIVHQLLRSLRVLPQGHVLALHNRWLAVGSPHRRNPSRVCAHSLCRYQPIPDS